ncbi:hypothetical protein GOP47_0029145 [Adiantum capillus-veneris]|nr:hypothetical protein GOP47_0029145 [Adiantum capillus-veneris]
MMPVRRSTCKLQTRHVWGGQKRRSSRKEQSQDLTEGSQIDVKEQLVANQYCLCCSPYLIGNHGRTHC